MTRAWYQNLLQAAGILSGTDTKLDEVCVIVGAMPQDNLGEIVGILDGAFLIAADEGFRYLDNRFPDLVVGDFDSLGYVPEGQHIVQHPVRKDDTDMMLAVKLALSQGKKRLVLLGGIGGRLDHTIANLNTLRYVQQAHAKAVLIGQNESVFLASGENVRFSDMGNGLISLFSYGDKTQDVTIQGLSYEVEHVCFENTFPLGVSNEFVNAPASVTVGEGQLLIIVSNP